MSTKLFVGLLGLIVVLYLVGAGVGLSRSSPKVDAEALNADWLKGLRENLAKPQRLGWKELEYAAPSSCLEPERIVVPSGGTCLVQISKSSTPAGRQMGIQVVAGRSLELTLQQKDALTLQQTVTENTDAQEWDIYQDGGTLTIVCLDSGDTPACELALK